MRFLEEVCKEAARRCKYYSCDHYTIVVSEEVAFKNRLPLYGRLKFGQYNIHAHIRPTPNGGRKITIYIDYPNADADKKE